MPATSKGAGGSTFAFPSLRCTNQRCFTNQLSNAVGQVTGAGTLSARLQAASRAPDVGGACPAGGGRARRVVWFRHPFPPQFLRLPLTCRADAGPNESPRAPCRRGAARGRPWRRCCSSQARALVLSRRSAVPRRAGRNGGSTAALVSAAAAAAPAANLPSVYLPPPSDLSKSLPSAAPPSPRCSRICLRCRCRRTLQGRCRGCGGAALPTLRSRRQQVPGVLARQRPVQQRRVRGLQRDQRAWRPLRAL